VALVCQSGLGASRTGWPAPQRPRPGLRAQAVTVLTLEALLFWLHYFYARCMSGATIEYRSKT
jgi:hypothetical protein